MPFKSKAQMRYLYANHPRIAKRWSKKYGVPKKLPERVRHKNAATNNMEDFMSLEEKIVQAFISTRNALVKLAQDLQEKEAVERKVKQLIPMVVEKLVENQRIGEQEKVAAARALQDPVKTLEILARTAEHRVPEPVERLGYPATTKTAGYMSKRASLDMTRFNGSSFTDRPDAGPRYSDVVFLKGLGLDHMLG